MASPPRSEASGSSTAAAHFSTVSPSSKSPNLDIPSSPGRDSEHLQELRSRRHSFTQGFSSLRHAGGVNSIDNFARSWTRAAGYLEITPSGRDYVSVSSRDEEEYPDSPPANSDAIEDQDDVDEITPLQRIHSGATYGSLGSISRYGSAGNGRIPGERLNETATRNAADLFTEQQRTGETLVVGSDGKEREPLLLRTVTRDDGRIEHVIVGQSTLPQTIFNSVNVLVGIGLLSLPLGLRYSGWLIGIIFFVFSALVTHYTAKLLAKCLDKSPDQALVTYSDIAYIAFGSASRVCVSILFLFELVAACVALVVLFADSLHVLIPGVSLTEWKILAGFILTPLSFLPLRVLSFSSILGIVCTFSIVSIILTDGLIKPDAPGSLRDPMPTYMFPQSWNTLPLSFGLLMSPWGGHGVFPNIYKDMRHPKKFTKAVNVTYSLTFVLDIGMAIIGLLMFGDTVRDEISSSILELPGYPRALSIAMVSFIAIIPLTKTPLSARPIVSTIEIFLGVDSRVIASSESTMGISALNRGVIKAAIRIAVNVLFVIVAILCPSFDRIIAFLGSALCFTICVILPLLFYLKIFGKEVGFWEKVMCWILVGISSVMATVGTVAAFVPRERLGG